MICRNLCKSVAFLDSVLGIALCLRLGSFDLSSKPAVKAISTADIMTYYAYLKNEAYFPQASYFYFLPHIIKGKGR